MAAMIEIDNLTRHFAGATAIDGLNLTIEDGGLTGLVGPDGAGKTTLLRLITGLLTPDSGTLKVAAAPEAIGYMPQKFGLYEDLTVMENLRLYARLHEVPKAAEKERFDRMLAFTDLGPFTGRLAGRLSGGMKQKLGLACTLLSQPRLLLLDEPGVGVDPVSRRELWKMVQELQHDGMTVVWSTSYLDEAERCARVVLLHESKLLYDGPPGKLSGKLKGHTWLFRDIAGAHRHVLGELLSRPEVSDGVIQGDSIRLVTAAEVSPEQVEKLAAGFKAHAEPVEPTFEDAFIAISGGGPGGESALARLLPDRKADGAVVVKAEKLTKRYGDFTAAEAITFDIRRGEIFGLLGPNGAGKSTTFKMMCGLLKPTSGRGSIAGMDLLHAGPAARNHLGYMAQKFSLYDGLSVLQNLRFFAGIYGLTGRRRDDRIQAMIEVFGFRNNLNDNAGDISLGFKQRLALACATMHDPEVLFLDEPTSGVAPRTRREFWTHINRMVEKQVTVMVTTHFMDEAEYCDRIALIYHGRAVALGTPDELKARAEKDTMEEAFIALVEREDQGR